MSGELSRTLEREGEDALANMVIAQFECVFGSEAAGTIAAPQATRWGVDPYFGGAWANPLPGALTARADLKAASGRSPLFRGRGDESEPRPELPTGPIKAVLTRQIGSR